MVFICCFQCDPRIATYIISVLSFLHFSVESVLLVTLDEDHRLVAEEDGIRFYTVFFTHLFILFSSVLLFFSAHYMNRLLCIPWIIGNVFNLLILSSLLLLIFMRIMSGFKVEELEKAGFILLTEGAMLYAIWIVLVFFRELNKYVKSGTKTPTVKSMFTLYDDDDEEAGKSEELYLKKSYFSKRPSKEKKVAEEEDNDEEEGMPQKKFSYIY